MYIEPLFEINNILSLGLPYSWHDRMENAYDDETWMGGVNVYLYPTLGAEIKFFTSYILHESPFHTFARVGEYGNIQGGDSFITGIEAKIEF